MIRPPFRNLNAPETGRSGGRNSNDPDNANCIFGNTYDNQSESFGRLCACQLFARKEAKTAIIIGQQQFTTQAPADAELIQFIFGIESMHQFDEIKDMLLLSILMSHDSIFSQNHSPKFIRNNCFHQRFFA